MDTFQDPDICCKYLDKCLVDLDLFFMEWVKVSLEGVEPKPDSEKALPFCCLPDFQRFGYSVLPSQKPVCDYFLLTKKGNPTLQPVRSSCNLY